MWVCFRSVSVHFVLVLGNMLFMLVTVYLFTCDKDRHGFVTALKHSPSKRKSLSRPLRSQDEHDTNSEYIKSIFLFYIMDYL